ncbi:MAG: hypothetical protein BWZ02_00651 [Lentisphaerae bacterium ADurb.BinA184]|nr:MAG: hypothetical protein BWZ02_00651 [Lentisphaerae bacterium ADurb.BinA184]
MLRAYLEDLESRISPAVEEELLADWRAFLDGRFSGGIFTPGRRVKAPSRLEWPRVWVNDALDDFEQMVLQQLRGCSDLLANGAGNLLCVRANYGTAIIPSLFGAEIFRMARHLDTLPTSIPLGGDEATVRRLIAAGVPGLHRSLAGQTLDTGRRYVSLFRDYPNTARYVRIYHPDYQGPMDICELLWGSSLFLDVLDRPALVHQFLGLITDTYAAMMREWQRIVPFSDDGTEAHWGFLHRGHITLRDDSAMNFSPAMFEEFIEPYDSRLLREFGGGVVHFCGRGTHYIHRAGAMPGVTGIAMSQPELNDMETIWRHTVDRGLDMLGVPHAAAEQALAAGRNLRGRVHCW